MQSVEVTIKGQADDPMVLVFASTDAPDTVAERLRTLTWIIRQVDGQGGTPRRRGMRSERVGAPETPTES